MKTLLTCAMIAMFSAAIYGCDSMGNDSGSKHEVEQKKTVYDANGNVVQQSGNQDE